MLERPVGLRQHPVRVALEDVDVRGDARDPRDELHRAGTGTDDGDPLAPQVDRVVPLRRVEQLPLEAVHARQVRDVRLVQRAVGQDDDPRAVLLPRAGPDVPAVGRLVELVRRDLGVEPDVRLQVAFLDDVLDVVEDLRLLRVHPAPVPVRREGVGVHHARHIAGAARVRVLPPGAADLAGLLQDDEVAMAGLGQLHRHAETGQAGPHDQHVRGLRWTRPSPAQRPSGFLLIWSLAAGTWTARQPKPRGHPEASSISSGSETVLSVPTAPSQRDVRALEDHHCPGTQADATEG